MKVGCVYCQDAEQHWHKQITWGRGSPEDFGAALWRVACQCGYQETQEKIFAADGGGWCWGIHARYVSDLPAFSTGTKPASTSGTPPNKSRRETPRRGRTSHSINCSAAAAQPCSRG